MAWTAPRTWVTGETVTAALMNAHIKDNFLETSAATVTTAGDIAFADAANSMGSRVAIGAVNTHLVSDGSAPVWGVTATDVDSGSGTATTTSYANLEDNPWDFAGAVSTGSITTGTQALVLFKAVLSNSTGGSITFLSFAVSGATTISATDGHAIWYESSNAADAANIGGFALATLTAGTNEIKLAGKVSANTGTIARPEIAVITF